MINRVVLLADESALLVIAGLSQLDRLLRTLEECFAPAQAGAGAPEVIIYGKSPNLLERRSTRLAASHRIAGQPIDSAPSGDTLVLRSNVIFRRGALARLLHSSKPCASFAILRPEDFPADWEGLSRRIGTRTDDSAWFLEGPSDIPKLERQLLRATGKPTDGFVSRTLNRPVSQLLSRWLVQTNVTPNQISFLVLSVLAASTWMLARGTPQGFVIGMLLFHLASVLDGCDGEIARAKFLETSLGGRLDTAVDLLGNHLLALAVGVGLWRQPGLEPGVASAYLLEGVLTAVGIALGVWGIARYTRPTSGADNFNEFGSSMVSESGIAGMFRPLARGAVQILRRDTYALIFVILAVLGHPEWILHCLAIGVALHFPVIAWSLWKLAKMPAPVKARDGAP